MDVSQFVWTEADRKQLWLNKPKPTKKVRKSKLPPGRFVKGPIPIEWIQRAIAHGNKSPNVALALWYRVGITKSNQVKLSAQTLAEFDVKSKAALRILTKWETAGLVTIERQRGRSPLVTVLPQ